MTAYAGEVSEDTAIHLYLYQSQILKNKNKELSKSLEKIAITEMHHLETLASMITSLGVAPAYFSYKNNKLVPFTTEYVSRNQDEQEILKIDIESERKAITYYEELIKTINIPNFQEQFRKIISQELEHIKIFSSFLK